MEDPDLSLLSYSSRDFDPTPEELISHYLKNHILKKPYPESGRIQEETVSGEDISPWDKFCDSYNPYPWETSTSIPTLYLFTKLSDVGITEKLSSIQKNRNAGGGTWHGNSAPIEVTSFADENVVVGYYKVLSFWSTDGTETKGQWIMYEYNISDETFPEVRKVRGWQNQVVCRIKRDDSKSNVGGKVTNRTSAPKKKASAVVPKKEKASPKKKPVPKKRKSSSPPEAVPNKRTRRTAQVYYGELSDSDDCYE